MTNRGARILLADIGGTNARFALADPAADAPLLRESVATYPVSAFASLADAARHHVSATRAKANAPIHAGVFAVAGRVDGDEARITNHPWLISRPALQAALGFEQLLLVNDFAAQAMALPLLQADDVVALGAARWSPTVDGRDQTYAVIGPGTGLGVGGLLLRGDRAWPLHSEGGHVNFAPGTPEEIQVLEHLAAQFGRVSIERLVCGPGLVNLHRALAELSGADPGDLQPADITAGAQRGDDMCLRAVALFCAVFGSTAGDLVLTLGAWDGLFLTGGLVPRLLPALRQSGFRARFEHKGRFSAAMARVPTLAVIHPHPGLLGAAAFAREFAGPAR